MNNDFKGMQEGVSTAQSESSFKAMIGKNVYNKKGRIVGVIDGIFFSKKSVMLCRVVGVNHYIGTGICRLDKFYLIDGRLVLDKI